jgi:hypothetical protein
MTQTQEIRTQAAKNELQRRIQQMLSSGQHDAGAVKSAMIEILEDWG